MKQRAWILIVCLSVAVALVFLGTKRGALAPQSTSVFPLSGRSGVPARTDEPECSLPEALFGIWQETDDSVFTLEFRPDGTFADKRNGIVAVFSRKDRQFTYSDVSATSTGKWSILTDRSQELLRFAMEYPRLPQPILPKDGIVVRKEFDIAPWYYEILLRDNCQSLIESATWIEDDPGYKYRRLR